MQASKRDTSHHYTDVEGFMTLSIVSPPHRFPFPHPWWKPKGYSYYSRSEIQRGVLERGVRGGP
jgi:hypothetical protein